MQWAGRGACFSRGLAEAANPTRPRGERGWKRPTTTCFSFRDLPVKQPSPIVCFYFPTYVISVSRLNMNEQEAAVLFIIESVGRVCEAQAVCC